MKTSTFVALLGFGFALIQLLLLCNPKSLQKFPRSFAWGLVLMLLGTGWFVYNVNNETISDFAAYKNLMMFGFAAVGILTCIFVQDFLAVRGLAVVLLLLASFTLNAVRWTDTPWRRLVALWAYTWIIGAMWVTVSPWRLRDYINWMTASQFRFRIISGISIAFGLFVGILGLSVF
ncbi:MAG: hypothetical protein SFY81_09710 [Verrucomicrobiota bacterium]|nr:hypothetical protein [Verrucomicrobiota bacterium]